jgi:hypothetical protein
MSLEKKHFTGGCAGLIYMRSLHYSIPHSALLTLYPHPHSALVTVSPSLFTVSSSLFSSSHCILIPFQPFSQYPSSPFSSSLYPHPPSVVLTVSSSPFRCYHCILILLQLFSLFSHPPSSLHTVFSSPASLCALSAVSLFFFITY